MQAQGCKVWEWQQIPGILDYRKEAESELAQVQDHSELYGKFQVILR